jgi:hypothetical protein
MEAGGRAIECAAASSSQGHAAGSNPADFGGARGRNDRARLLASMTLVLLALGGCHAPPLSGNATGVVGPGQATAAALPPPVMTGAIEVEPVPDSWKRYLLDHGRFSALFPATPKATEVGQDVLYQGHNPAGAMFMIACGPATEDPRSMKRAQSIAAGSGRIISEGHPDFFGTEGYLSHVRLPDGSERVLLFVEYEGRHCTVTTDVMARDETSMQFIESFRPEPEAR